MKVRRVDQFNGSHVSLIASALRQRPVSVSMVKIQPSILQGPLADSYRRGGSPINLPMLCSGSIPSTEWTGPVMPRSVMYPVPFGRTVASEVCTCVCVLNLLGRFTLDNNTDNPFPIADGYMAEIQEKIILVDFHAEGTSEKRAMGYLLDGKASAVWGTHTHVQTSDAAVLPKGTGYITDLGMTGPVHSVLGIDPEQSIGKFMGDPPRRYESAKGPCKMEGCIFTIDTETGRCRSAEAIRLT